MSGGGGYKYHVIQFLEAPYKDIADIVCVPKSWVQTFGADVPIVKVLYPDEEPSLTENRVMSRKRKSESWKSFLSVVRYSTDSYENAKFYIQEEINNSKKNKGDFYVDGKTIQDRRNKSEKKNAEHTLSAKANAKTSISTQNAMSAATIDNDACVLGMVDTLGSRIPSKSANTITLKRKALPDPDKENENKRFSVNKPDESDNQVAGPSSKALDSSSKSHLSPTPEDSDEDLWTQETLRKKFNDNSTEMRQTINQNFSKQNHSLDPEIIVQLATSPIFARWCMLMQELQEVFNNSMFKELINKLLNKDNDGSAPQNNDLVVSTSSDPVETAKLNEVKRYKKPLGEKKSDDGDYDDKPLKKNSRPKKIKKANEFIEYTDVNSSEESDLDLVEELKLPPEYDANDSRWTLEYHEPAPGLVELMPNTGVYVCTELPNFKRFSQRFALARRLLREIFTDNAMSVCKLPSTGAIAMDRDETNVRPALDKHAISVLIKYVTGHAKKEGWPKLDIRSIIRSMRDLLLTYRQHKKYLR